MFLYILCLKFIPMCADLVYDESEEEEKYD